MTNTRLFAFVGGESGTWRVTKSATIVGVPLDDVSRLSVVAAEDAAKITQAKWALKGITSNERYVIREEKQQLVSKQQGLGRSDATMAVMIPMSKNAAWWALTQDERRKIFEEQSHHNQIGMKFLPAIARKLYHCRDLSENQPFDFITWFEFAPEHECAFEQLLAELHATEEWRYVEREVQIWMTREISD
ncbi:MAG: chlorite dismutase family protein [Methylophilaceae bacterium]